MAKRTKKHLPGDGKRRCVLCGRLVFRYEWNVVVGSTGRVVCEDCLCASERVLESKQLLAKNALRTHDTILTPQEIIRRLDEAIIGQEQAKRAVAAAMWKQQLRASGDQSVPRSNLLLYGPAGCGKTALVQEAARIVDLPFIAFDATTLSETGYRGRDAQDIVKDLITRFDGHPKLSNGVLFIDEADKLAARGSESRTMYNRGTQHALLKLVEGTEIDDGMHRVSTDQLLFIFGGAFTGMSPLKEPEKKANPIGFLRAAPLPARDSRQASVSDFVRYGMEPELMGRVGQYVPVEQLTGRDLKRILMESRLSAYLQYQNFFSHHGVHLEFSEKFLDDLVEKAERQGTGARALNTLVEKAVEPLLFQLAEGKLRGCVREVRINNVE